MTHYFKEIELQTKVAKNTVFTILRNTYYSTAIAMPLFYLTLNQGFFKNLQK